MKLNRKVAVLLGSRKFFWVVFAFFIVEGLWVALSSMYPMAFDEDFHFGIIKIYANHAGPFLAGQPENASQFSAVARDPSYLYHFLMSFPYRFIAFFTDNQAAQVIFLRLINIGLFASSLLLFARVFKKAGTSPALTNTALALFVLIPIVPQLAGQINYDNLFMVWTAWLCLLVYDLVTQLRQNKLSLATVGWLLLVLILGSLTKYAFLPIAFAAAVFAAVVIALAARKHGKTLLKALKASGQKMGGRTRLSLAVLLLLSLVLFVQRYGVNLVQYHTPLPDCSAVLSVEECKKYGPWERNYRFAHDKGYTNPNPWNYNWEWVKGMYKRLFFVINGPHHGYANYLPVPLPGRTFMAIGVLGIIATAIYFRRVFSGSTYMWFLLTMPLCYVLVLWVNNYTEYLETGRVVAVNGRYLLPILLPLAIVFGKGLSLALNSKPVIKPWAAAIAILLFVQAGGVFSFILRSDSTWDWPNSTVIQVNNGARKILDPIIIQGPKQHPQ